MNISRKMVLESALMNIFRKLRIIKIKILCVCLYVDDLIFTCSNLMVFKDLKKKMTEEFEMTDLELMSYYFGNEVKQSEKRIFLS